MKIRSILLAAVTGLLASGCFDGPTEPVCTQFTPQIAGTNGDTITLTTDVRYIPTVQAAGPELASCSAALVHYTLYVDDAQIESTRGGNPFRVDVGYNAVIAGFEQGIIGMSVGDQRRVIVPPALGYGADPVVNRQTGQVVIPANSILIFDIEMLAFSQ